MRSFVTSTTAGRFMALLVAGMLWTVNLTAQTVTLSVSDAPIQKVCTEIEKQTGYYFVYPKDLEKTPPVSIDLKKAPLQQALEALFKGRPYTWSITDNVISVNMAKQGGSNPATVMADTITLTGRIINKSSESLVNATVSSLLTKKATVTDDMGRFSLKGLRAGEDLLVSYIGYKSQTVKFGQRRSIIVILEAADNDLDKVVVQAYGTTSRRLATGNIGVMTAEEIQKQPITNPLSALTGRIPGLDIVAMNGNGSGAFKVEIRGRNSIDPSFASDPLYIVDGVPLTILDIGGTGVSPISGSNHSLGFNQANLGQGQSPLYSLNPADIASIEVLKDADATAIYGSRGANGVILINTKKGKPGKSAFGLNVTTGASYVTRFWDMLGTSDYLAMRRESFRNDGLIPTAANAPDQLIWDSTRYTNWQKFNYGGTGQWTNVQADLSGGTAQTTYRLGAGYGHTTDITTFSGSNDKINFSFNINSKSLDSKFKWNFTTNYSYITDDNIKNGGSSVLFPNAPPLTDSTGALNWIGWGKVTGISSYSNIYNPRDSKTKFLTTNLALSYTILKGLVLSTSLGYNTGESNQSDFTTIRAQDPTATTKPTGSARYGTTRTNNISLEPQLEYNGLIHEGRFNVLVGGTLHSNVTNSSYVYGSGFTNDALLKSLSYAAELDGNNRTGNYKYAGIYARIGYDWQGKYIVNLNGRRDGSSRFGPGKQYGNFGSIGAAWNASEEEWLGKSLPAFISFIKFRSSYGLTGSDAVGDYQYLSQWGNNGLTVAPYNGIVVLLPQILENENFHWQMNKKLEVAIDLAFLNDRINFEAAWYRNRCNNQLVSYPVPEYTGFNSVVANRPANVQNAGWEFMASAKLIEHTSFRWSVNANLSFNRNKLVSYPDFEHSPFYATYKIGESLDNVYLYKYTGIDPLTGQRTYEDYNHDGIISKNDNVPPGSADDDQYVAINRAPKYYGSMSHQFSYKGFELSFVLSYKKRLGPGSVGTAQSGMFNISTWAYDHRWRYPGDAEAQYPRLTTVLQNSNSFFSSSSGHWTDASVIRLQNVAFAYAVPAKWVKKAGMSSVRFIANAQNLFFITKYKGIDPDANPAGSIPPSRTLTAGISCSF